MRRAVINMEHGKIVQHVRTVREMHGSDIHVKSGSNPIYRVAGDIIMAEGEKIQEEDIVEFLSKHTTVDVDELKWGNHAIDFSLSVDEIRLRGNAYRDNNGLSLALRLLTMVDSDFANLGIPEVLKQLVQSRSGLILITGPTGSGKTTTLTYLLKYINQTQHKHVIMLEDPIEFIHTSDKCVFSQREIGRDTRSYGDAIVEAMRQDPDIIMVGEMRDHESIEAALRAAETGHLVISTLHTKGAVSSITRIIDIFAAEQQNQIRTQLSMALLGVVSQQLCPGRKPGRRHLATEVMIMTDPIRAQMKQDKLHLIPSTIQTSRHLGMYTMRHSLEELLERGRITRETFENYQIGQ